MRLLNNVVKQLINVDDPDVGIKDRKSNFWKRRLHLSIRLVSPVSGDNSIKNCTPLPIIRFSVRLIS